MKFCNSCETDKPRADFSKKSSAKDGLRSRCKDCEKATTAEYRKQNPEKAKETARAWRKANPDKAATTYKEWVKNNRDKRRASDTKFRATHPEKRAASGAKWRDANRDRKRAMDSAYYAANKDKAAAYGRLRYINNREAMLRKNAEWAIAYPDKIREFKKAWDARNPDRKRIHVRNRRARIRSAEGQLSPDIEQLLFIRQEGRCVYCNTDLTTVPTELDHVIAIAKGGTNSDDNVQLLCRTCNRRKSTKHPDDFAQQIFEELATKD